MRKQRSKGLSAAWAAVRKMLRAAGVRIRRIGSRLIPEAFSGLVAATTMLLAFLGGPRAARS
jgi:hypothetical protein